VNEQCVHGIPGDRELLEGDIVSLDGGVILDDLYTDACVTVGVGQISAEAKNLIETGEEALKIAVKTAKAGVRIGDISAAVQQYVEGRGFTIVRALTGHGLGSTLHQFPDVPNFGKAGTGPVLPVGALIAVEPIVSAGGANIREESDGWTICTVDDSLATHSEHTILITERGAEIIA
jgi:methionyl aminopeptidase